ncbi:MAG: hypothetical protein ABL973_02305 [Micropepsaceae bacterium]
MARKLIEYALVVLVAIIVSLLLIYLFFQPGSGGKCTGCVVTSLPQQRQECEKQFSGGVGAPRVLQGGSDDEYLVGFYDPAVMGGGGAYSASPSSYPGTTTTSAAPTPTAGYVIVRTRPQSTYDSTSGGYTGGSFNPATVTPGQAWDEVRVAVVTYVSPLRNESVCAEKSVKFFEDKFEAYCDLPTRFAPGDAPKQSYRVFVMNQSNTPIEYCIVSNCDESHGKICQIELATGQ